MKADTRREALKSARLESWGVINRFRMEAVLRYAGPSILDVGCASGAYVDYLNAHGRSAWGLDYITHPSWGRKSRLAFVQGDAESLPFPDEAFDTLLSFEVLEHLLAPDLALASFHRVCRRSLILTVPNAELPEDMLRAGLVYAHWRDPTHCSFFTPRSLADILERAGFRVEFIRRANPILPDYLVLRSLHLPAALAFAAARVLRRIPFRKKHFMTLLAVACKQ